LIDDLIDLQIASDQFRLSPWTPPAIRCKIANMISSRQESKSIHHGGDFMNGIKRTGRSRLLASTAMLFGAMFIMLLPAYAQQDVNPDWYDPTPNAAVVHPAQPAAAAQSSRPSAATHQHQQMAKSLSPAAKAGKPRVKDAKLDQTSPNNAPAADDRAYGPVASVERSPRLGVIGQR
jgi:hypothetical protein